MKIDDERDRMCVGERDLYIELVDRVIMRERMRSTVRERERGRIREMENHGESEKGRERMR